MWIVFSRVKLFFSIQLVILKSSKYREFTFYLNLNLYLFLISLTGRLNELKNRLTRIATDLRFTFFIGIILFLCLSQTDRNWYKPKPKPKFFIFKNQNQSCCFSQNLTGFSSTPEFEHLTIRIHQTFHLCSVINCCKILNKILTVEARTRLFLHFCFMFA